MNGIDVNMQGFGETGFEMIQNLHKALTAGSGVDAGSFVGGRALIPESLENTLVNILFTQDDAVLFKRLKKKTIKGPVHQWDERTEVGMDDGAWVAEAADSEDSDQTIARKYATVKYLQSRRVVTLQATLANMIEPAIALEQNAGALWIVRNVEKALFSADSAVVATQPDGLDKQIPVATNVLDVRGASADSSSFEDKIGESCRLIRDNYGKAGLIITSTMVMQDVQRLLRDRIRFGPVESGLGGSVFDKYPTPFGTPELVHDIFVKESTTHVVSSLTAKRPDPMTISGGPTMAADALSQFAAGDVGNYYYRVSALNAYGESTSVDSTVAAVAAGEKVTLAITKGSATPTAYRLYRSKKGATDATDARLIGTYAYTASPMNVVDYNADLPGCSSAYVLTMDEVYDAIEWFQFLPLMKFDLYPTSSAVYPFLMLLFGALALKKPKQHVRIKNISPANLGWF